MSELTNFIDPLLVVNKTIFEAIQDIAVCCICTGLVIDPRQCIECENCFCRSCIEKWNSKSMTCPNKCNSWALREPSRVVKSVLSRLVLKCPKNCLQQLKYEDVVNHLKECDCQVIDCPTCGAKVSEKLVQKDKYVQLKIENEMLRKRIEELEALNLSYSDKVTKRKDEINVNFVAEKNIVNNILKKDNIQKKVTKFSQNKSNISLHDPHSKVLYRFTCCGKEFDCIECHNENEVHAYTHISSLTCKECSHVSQISSDIVCSFCGANFIKEKSNAKNDMIKYKHASKKITSKNNTIMNINPINEENETDSNNNLTMSHYYKRAVSSKISYKKK